MEDSKMKKRDVHDEENGRFKNEKARWATRARRMETTNTVRTTPVRGCSSVALCFIADVVTCIGSKRLEWKRKKDDDSKNEENSEN
jgi:hypothetical protein